MSELCRKCGESLMEFSFCVICKEALQQTCKVCMKLTDERFHKDCLYELQILKLFPIPPDQVFEKRKILDVPFTMDFTKSKRKKNINEKDHIVLAIEKILAKMGKPVLENVHHELYLKYHCYLADCYENPEYLITVLKDLFGSSHLTIVESIKRKVGESVSQSSSKGFLTKLECYIRYK